jgi:hypothetical protein
MTRHAIPTAVPARYVLHGDRVLIHLVPTLDDAPWHDGEVVGLHVYAISDEHNDGWTISVVGRAHGTPRLRAVDTPGQLPWLLDGGGDLIELTTEIVRGERLTRSADPDTE